MYLSIFSTIFLLPLVSIAAPTASIQNEERDFDVTRNDLVDGICRPVTVIFARGTIELGNVGLVAGPPFFDKLAGYIGDDNLAVQGVDYDASILGYLEGGDPDGANTLRDLAQQAADQCPDTKIILSGYSQGAQVVHLGAAMLGDDVTNRVASVILFGDPDDGDVIPDIPTVKIDTICLVGDLICDGLPLVFPQHLAYGFTADQAAQFAAASVQQ